MLYVVIEMNIFKLFISININDKQNLVDSFVKLEQVTSYNMPVLNK